MVTKINSQKFRFIIVGLINTVLDFGIYAGAIISGMSPVTANYISTTIALSFSFIANKKYTFQSSGRVRFREIVGFLIVTLIGLWILQPLIIGIVISNMEEIFSEFTLAVIGKLLATVVTLVWNYVLYDKVVFKKHIS